MPKQVVKEIEARFRANTSAYRQEIAQAGKITAELRAQIQQASATISQAGNASGKQAGAITRSLSSAEKAADRISKTAQGLVGKERELTRAVNEQKRRLADLRSEYQRISADVSRLNGVYDTIKEATKGLDLSTPLAKQREQASAELDRLEQEIRTLQAGIAGAGNGGLVSVGDSFIGMDEAKSRLQELIAASDQAAERFWKLDAAISAIGEDNLGYASKTGLKQLQTEIGKYQSRMSQLELQAGQTENRLTSYTERLEDVRRGEEQLGESTERLSEQVAALGNAAAEAEERRQERIAQAAAKAAEAEERRRAKADAAASKAAAEQSYAENLRMTAESAVVADQRVVELNRELEALAQRQALLREAGVGNMGYEEYAANSARIQEIKNALTEYEKAQRSANEEAQKTPTIFSRIAQKMSDAGQAISASITARLKEATQGFLQLGKGARSGGNGVLSSALTMAKAMIGVRSLYMLIRKLKSAFTSGMKELANYSTEVKTSLGSMSAAMGQMQNSIATAFAPLVTTVAPYITAFIRHIADAFNAVGAFFASLTGQSSYTRAVYNYQGVAGAADKAAGSTKKAADAQKELNRQLMGFDQINKLSDNDSGSGSGGGGGGGSGGDSGGNGLSFVTESIPGIMSDWAERFKEAWANADFTEIGGIIGAKLRDALDSIPWDDIKDGAKRAAKSLATLLNGFVETEGLANSIATTVTNAIDTALIAVTTFLETVHWDSVGKFVGEAIQNGIKTFPLEKVGRLISDTICAGLDFAGGILDAIDPEELGRDIYQKLKDFTLEIKIDVIIPKAGDVAVKAVDLIRGTFKGFFDSLGTDITKWASDVTGIDLTGIGEAIKTGIGTALKLVDPWEGLKAKLEKVELIATLLKPFAEDSKTWSEFGSKLKKAFSDPFDVAVKAARAIVEGFADWVKDIKINWNPLDKDFGIKLPDKSLEMYVVARAKKLALDDNDVSVDAETKKVGVRNNDVSVDANSKDVDVKDKKVGVKAAAKAVSVANKVVNKIKAVAPKVEVKNKTVYVSVRYKNRPDGDTRPRAKGGVFHHGSWSDIPQYAGGTTNAGTMFVAGEAGPEIVGNIGGRTEVLNKSQIASAIYSAVVSAVGQYKSYFSSISSNIAQIPRAVSQVSVGRESASASLAGNGSTSVQASAPFAETIARQLSSFISQSNSGVGSNQPIVVKVELDGRVVAESSVREWQRQARSGRHPLSELV